MRLLLVSSFVAGLIISYIPASSSELRYDGSSSRAKRSTESRYSWFGVSYTPMDWDFQLRVSFIEGSFFFYQQPEYPRDCKEVYDQCEDQSADGVYLIKPEGSPEPFEVYCNNSIDGGGWSVFQRRLDGSVDFHRNWNEFKNGFGFLRGDFWLGNDKISYLTNQKTYEIRIDMNNVNGQPYFAKYNLFRISDEGSKYRLVGLGDYDSTSTANNDGMAYSRNFSFTTHDQDNDHDTTGNCALSRHGAWWYNSCAHARLNGLYNAGSADPKSVFWYNLPGGYFHLKYSEMKIRPLQN